MLERQMIWPGPSGPSMKSVASPLKIKVPRDATWRPSSGKIKVIAGEGRFEEELFLTTFLFEEGKHAVFFRRFMDEVIGGQIDSRTYHTPCYEKMFYEDLPNTMNRRTACSASPGLT